MSSIEAVNLVKCDKVREIGNAMFKEGKLFAAIAHYNKSLILARGDDVRASLCYANRSSVYLKMEYFEHCLNNINLALPSYPRDQIQKLHERRAKCLEKMKTIPDKAIQPFNHPWKLSYKDNPKVPFFIKALEYRDDEQFGKHLITTKDLKAGDVIAIIDRPWKIPMRRPKFNQMEACYNCLSINYGDLIPGKCGADLPPLFCGEKCRDEYLQFDKHHEDIHEMEGEDDALYIIHRVFAKIFDAFGSVENMKNFVETSGELNQDICDFDWTVEEDDPIYWKNMLLVAMSNRATNVNIEENLQNMADVPYDPDQRYTKPGKTILQENTDNREFLKKVLGKIGSVVKVGIMLDSGHCENPFAILTHPALMAVSECCDDNIYMSIQNSKEIIWFVTQPIAAGGKLFANGTPYYEKEQPKKCDNPQTCIPCREDWAKSFDYAKAKAESFTIHSKFFMAERTDPKIVESYLKFHKQTANFINKNFKGYRNDSKVRQMIAVRKMDLRFNLVLVGCPFPPANGLFRKHSKVQGLSEEFGNMIEFPAIPDDL